MSKRFPSTVKLPDGRALRLHAVSDPLKGKIADTPYLLDKKQKACATCFIPEEVRAFKRGRWASRKQAIAVGLARAAREC